MSELVPIRLTRGNLVTAFNVAGCQIAQVLCSGTSRSVHGEDPSYGAYVTRKMFGCVPELALACYLHQLWHGPEPLDTSMPDIGANIDAKATPYLNGHLQTYPFSPDAWQYHLMIWQPERDPLLVYYAGWLWGTETKQQRWWSELIPGSRRYAFNVPQTHLRPPLPPGVLPDA